MQGPPPSPSSPRNTQHPSWAHAEPAQHHPSIVPGPIPGAAGDAEGAAGTAHPPLPSQERVVLPAARQIKVRFAFPNRAGENCNKDKV